jgi:predicted site-specific integrase-resolvase
MEEKWLTFKEIMRMLGITRQTLNNWRRNGNIIYKRLSAKTFMYMLPESKIIRENNEKKRN